MTKIIDNSRETLASLLSKEFNDFSEIAIASAYFNIRGYVVYVNTSADRITGDGALIIRINI